MLETNLDPVVVPSNCSTGSTAANARAATSGRCDTAEFRWLRPGLLRSAMDAMPEVDQATNPVMHDRVAGARNALRASIVCSTDAFILRSPDGSAVYAPITCDRKWCPRCMFMWSASLTSAGLEAVVRVPARQLRHLVLTVPNAPHGALDERICFLYSAFRQWRDEGRRGRLFGVKYWDDVFGYLWKLEIDHHEASSTKFLPQKGKYHRYLAGWHPHIHAILHVPAGIDMSADSAALNAWRRIVGRICEAPAAPWISRATTEAGIVREVVKYAAKPMQIAGMSAGSLAELALAVHARRFHGSQGSLSVSLSPAVDGDLQMTGSLGALVADERYGFVNGKIAPPAARALAKFIAGSSLATPLHTRIVNSINAKRRSCSGANLSDEVLS